jgi:hypothetical protein
MGAGMITLMFSIGSYVDFQLLRFVLHDNLILLLIICSYC